ncbi:hypothetical protein ACFW2Y_09130 [Streptomyces sp. NPDC058877]|uniref:hypothetical protein n=1 Tax=Streptomyces sp. NPDC058877 TaxID=3346665 RepID=UPI0036C430BC
MVAIIKCREYEDEYLKFLEKLHQSRRHDWEWSFTRQRDLWSKGCHLLLIASTDTHGRYEITRVGKSVRRRGARDQEQQLRVTHVCRLRSPLPLAAQRTHTEPSTTTSERRSNALSRSRNAKLATDKRQAQKLLSFRT